MFTSCYPVFWTMRCPLLMLCLCTLASSVPCVKPNEHHTLHDAYSRSLMLARKIHEDVRILLRPYEEQLGITDSQVSSLFMKGLPTCSYNYTDWLSLEDTARLQQDREYLQVFHHHINACCSSEGQLGAEHNQALELLQFSIRDLQAHISEQLKLLQQPAVRAAAVNPAPMCNHESVWLGRMEGYVVLSGLEKCAQKVVRDYTLLRSQQQQ